MKNGSNTVEFDAKAPKAVETVVGFSEFADKHRQLKKNKSTIVDSYYNEFVEGLRNKSTHAVYLGNRAALGSMLKDRLKSEGFNPICKPVNGPVWIAVELGV